MNCLTNNKNKRGFSLIELMVVVAIMGILASIGIPQYLRYRDTASWGRIDSELQSTKRAFTTCVSSMSFEQCDAVNELGLTDVENVMTGSLPATARFCLQLSRDIGGFMSESCISLNSFNAQETITSNRAACAQDGGAYHAVNNNTAFVQATNAGAPANCRGASPQNKYDCLATWDGACAQACGDERDFTVSCGANPECIGAGFNYCVPATQGGVCGTNTGLCT